MAAVSSSPVVQAIDQKSVHQICSGQVVLSIATAMKELVENSLDAGATNIDIKLKNHGADVLEVNDNGYGLEPHNFEALTLKHHTSKLRDFSDLTSVETFGFRGEALSSLCALSKLSVTTHHCSQAAATRLEYDHNGKLVAKHPCARDQGTTVSLQNLFSTLPVRHREFLRNIKREFTKLIHVLQGYCLISTGVRITCSNQVEKGKKTTIVSTNGSDQVKDNITCVFGPKQVQTVMAIEQYAPSEEDCNDLGLDATKLQQNLFKISGYISKPDHGMGRSSADRQFLYINKRPCDLTKVSRVVNEVYHMYNRHQYPFVILDVSLARDGVDVNVTPDKRQVFVQEEKLLLATIKTSLKKMFEPSTVSFDFNQKPLTQIKLSVDSFVPNNSSSVDSQKDEELQGHKSSPSGIKQDEKVSEPHTSVMSFSRDVEKGKFPSLNNFKRKFSSLGESFASKSKEPCPKQAKLTSIFSTKEKVSNRKLEMPGGSEMKDSYPACEIQNFELINNNNEQCESGDDQVIELKEMVSRDQGNLADDYCGGEREIEGNREEFLTSEQLLKPGERVDSGKSGDGGHFQDRSVENEMKKNAQRDSKLSEESIQSVFDRSTNLQDDISCEPILVIPKHYKASSSEQNQVFDVFGERKGITVNFSMGKLKNILKTPSGEKRDGVEARLFRAKITPDSNSSAENELRKNISKDMFKEMEILGQFNLGFIIAKLDNDLFIIDQHASDEKFNFEDQQRNTTIKSQRLIIPQRLELTASNEAILMDNIEIFQKNGFEFEIDHNAPAMKKIKLVSLPMSKNWTFGVEDIEELIFMLSDSPSVMCRPSRVRKMFASRACRMSIMVGTALNQAQMKKIVCHMGEIEHPWNCPHGRPTMRHLINLGMLPTTDVD